MLKAEGDWSAGEVWDMIGNWLRTAMLMAGITALFGLVGTLLGGLPGMVAALAIGGATNFWAYWFSDKAALRMNHAQEVDENTGLYRMVRELAGRAGIPVPRVYLVDEEQPNAFATGRNPENAVPAATTGIMRILSERELRGEMAHELSHIKHRDTLTPALSATVAGAVSFLAQFGALMGARDAEGRPTNPLASLLVTLLAPLAAMLIQFPISRSRELEADRGGAEIGGDPQALASAPNKIHRHARCIPMAAAVAHPQTAQMMIMNPLSGSALARLISTHPDTGERIARLQALAAGAGHLRARPH